MSAHAVMLTCMHMSVGVCACVHGSTEVGTGAFLSHFLFFLRIDLSQDLELMVSARLTG